ncbi:hypothetical protein Q4555_12155 [Octadecabacter sp. 1_MG-2023]|nr:MULTISPECIES: hypothetical protein [unclassified Octadecabacter]MDO6735424.1 hypothetical protein [Octadecabacter sp. 1_MG-2023]
MTRTPERSTQDNMKRGCGGLLMFGILTFGTSSTNDIWVAMER